MNGTNLPSPLKKHPIHYQDGGDLIVIVGDTLFRLASVFFTRESEVFRGCLSRTGATNAGWVSGLLEPDGDSPSLYTIAIQPTGCITPDDFAQLCGVFFNSSYSLYNKSLEEWKTVRRLAIHWQFSEVERLATQQLCSIGGSNGPPIPQRQTDFILSPENTTAFAPVGEHLDPLYPHLVWLPTCQTLSGGWGMRSVRGSSSGFGFAFWTLVSLVWASAALLLGIAPLFPDSHAPNTIAAAKKRKGAPGLLDFESNA